jgi:hypothetical protein
MPYGGNLHGSLRGDEDTTKSNIESLNEAKANSYDRIIEFFKNDEEIKPYYEKISKECIDSNCQSLSVMIILTVKELLDKIDTLESNQATWSRSSDSIENYKNKIYK